MAAIDSAAALKERHVRHYNVKLENETLAESFAKDFNGISNGLNVTVSARQSLEEIFMNYYGDDRK